MAWRPQPGYGSRRRTPGSPDEEALRAWVDHLATLPEIPGAAGGPRQGRSRAVLRRLTRSQYNQTVRDLPGDVTRPADSFPKEDFIHGFTNQADGQSISPLRGGDHRNLLPCAPSDACRARFVAEFGRRAFRRPLSAVEIGRYEKLFASQPDFPEGAQLVVEAMLQSPYFLFHLEPGAYGIASRLSYFLWDTMPDEALLKAAGNGELETAAGIEGEVKRMLARAALEVFLGQWLRFDRLRAAIRDRRLFPEFTAELVNSMVEETTRLFQHLVWGGPDFRELFTAEYSFLNAELAKLYALPAPAEPWNRVSFPRGSARAGLLGQGTFLTRRWPR